MTPRALERTQLATKIMSKVLTGTRLCWVCANRGHGHRFTGCQSDRCPCGRRQLAPVAPAWFLP